MPTSASAHFETWLQGTTINSIDQTLTVSGTDYTSRVTKFPTIARDSRKVVGGNVIFTMYRDYSFVTDAIASKQHFGEQCEYSFGVSSGGGKETVGMFKGVLTKVSAMGKTANLTFSDKFLQMQERKIGDNEDPEPFSADNPADLAWTLMVFWAGLDGTYSPTNPDIDYAAWSSWHAGFANDSIDVEAQFDGQSVTEALQTIAKLTDSVIYQSGEGKVFCAKWTGIGSSHGTITDSFTIGDVSVEMSKEDLINKVTVLYDYNTAQDSFEGTVTVQNTTSVTSWGLHETIYDDKTVWYTTGAAAQTHAERLVYRRHEPNAYYKMNLPPRYLLNTVGDILTFTSDVVGVSSKYLVAQRFKYDMEKGLVNVVLDEGMGASPSPFLSGFVLDDEVLGLLDQDYNPLIG